MKKHYFNIKQKIKRLKNWSNNVYFPGFGDMSLLDVMVFFGKGLKHGNITTRASSVAYKFFIALIPAILVFLCFIPYVPVQGFQQTFIEFISSLFPPEIYSYIDSAIIEIATHQRPDILSIGFIMAIFFSVNGMNGLMQSFNETYHNIDKRSIYKQYFISLALVFLMFLIALIIMGFANLTEGVLDYFVNKNIIKKDITYNLLKYGKWLFIIVFAVFSISIIYYFAPSYRKKYKEILPGTIFASLLSLVVTLGLNFYISNISNLNEFFGSIGTLIVTLLWIYYNAIILLLGFEFNISIKSAKREK